MADRVTAKSNIATINVPSVTNAELNTMLQNEICDNVVFKEDTAVAQVSSVSTIALDFTAKDRINLTRTGGSLSISVSGIADGQSVFVLITKTIGQEITFSGVTDITPNISKVTELATVLYQIIRKAANYYALAYVKTIVAASDTNEGIASIATIAECNALTSTTKIVTPGRIPIASEIQEGLIEIATQAEVDALADYKKAIVPATLPIGSDAKKGILQIATAAECNGFSVSNKAVVPTRIPIASTTQKGVSKFATSAQVDAGTDSDQGGSLVVIPSELKRKYDAVGVTLYYHGMFRSASNSLIKIAGYGTLTLESDLGVGSWEFEPGKVLTDANSIVSAFSRGLDKTKFITNIFYNFTEFDVHVIAVQASGDTDFYITIQEIINPV